MNDKSPKFVPITGLIAERCQIANPAGRSPVTPCPCKIEQFDDEMACLTCKKRWDTNDSNPPSCVAPLDTVAGASQIFDEMRAIALGFMKRTEDVENQLNFIVATVYVNLKKRAEQGDTWAGEIVIWMDAEIAKLKDFRERYLVNIAGRPA